jgi:hypothetical protein
MTPARPKPTQAPAQPASRAAGPSRSADTRAIIILLAVCLTLGLTGIRWGLPDAAHPHYSFHPDESAGLTSSLSILDPSRPLFPTIWAYEQGPFFFDVAAVALRVVSLAGLAGIESNPDFSSYARLLLVARLLVVLLYCGVVLLVYDTVRRMWGSSTALLAAMLTALSPALVTNAHYFKNDIPLAFTAALTLCFSLRILETGRTRDYVWAGVLCGVTAATKYHGAAVATLVVAAHFLRLMRHPKRPLLHGRLLLALAGAGTGLIVAIPGLLLHPESVKEGVMREFARRAGEKTGFMLVTGRDNPGLLITLLYGLGIVPLFAALGSVVYLISKKRDPYLLLVLSFTAVFLLLLVFFKASYVRYLVPLVPFLMIPVARAAVLFGRRAGLQRTLAIALGAGVVLYTLLNSLAYLIPMTRTDPRIAATDWLARSAPAGSRVTVETSAGEGYHFADTLRFRLQRVFETRQGNNRDTGLLNQTDFFVASEAVYRKYLKQLAELPRERLFYDRLLNSPQFREVADFDLRPELFGLRFEKGFPPPDLMYILPRIRIFERSR